MVLRAFLFRIGGMKNKQNQSLQSLLKQKQRLLKRIRVPENALPGSLSVGRFRCGKKGCHCNTDDGHEKWVLTYMNEGSKRVKHIPTDLVDQVRHQVEEGKAFKEAINQVFAANAELVFLLRKRES